MTSLARTERLALVALMRDLGPNAPTLCEGWATHDMAAHLVTRERQPAAGPGLIIKPLHGLTEKLEHRTARLPYDTLLQRLEEGPPRWSIGGLSEKLDNAVNLSEFFIHHEDVRRLVVGAGPRELPADLADRLWRMVRFSARALSMRSRGLRVVLEAPGRPPLEVGRGDERVVIQGEVGELVLWLSGRRTAAQVEISGEGAERLADLKL
jgi:uncharacterized protein (TIGR03085 family)